MPKYYSKDCLWYEKVKFSIQTKEWIRANNPPISVIEDLNKIIKNNALFEEACK